MKLVAILLASFALCLQSCSKKWDKAAPVWLVTVQDTFYNFRLTYHADTAINTFDEVLVFKMHGAGTDTLKGINCRIEGTVYNWQLPVSGGYNACSLMRSIDGKLIPISSSTFGQPF